MPTHSSSDHDEAKAPSKLHAGPIHPKGSPTIAAEVTASSVIDDVKATLQSYVSALVLNDPGVQRFLALLVYETAQAGGLNDTVQLMSIPFTFTKTAAPAPAAKTPGKVLPTADADQNKIGATGTIGGYKLEGDAGTSSGGASVSVDGGVQWSAGGCTFSVGTNPDGGVNFSLTCSTPTLQVGGQVQASASTGKGH